MQKLKLLVLLFEINHNMLYNKFYLQILLAYVGILFKITPQI